MTNRLLLKSALMSGLAASFLAGCSPGNSGHQSSGPTTVSSQSVANSTCVEQIRQQMMAKSLQFQSKAELQSQIDEANRGLAAFQQSKYNLAQVRGVTQSLGITYSSSTSSASNTSVEYNLSVNDAEMDKPFSFSIAYSTPTVNLNEQFEVDKNCQMMSTSMEYEVKGLVEGGYSDQDTTYYVTGEVKNNSKTYPVPAGKKFALSLDQGLDGEDPFTILDRLDPQLYFPGGSLGLIRYQIETAPAQTFSAFGQSRTFQTRKFEILSDTDQVIMNDLILEQPDTGWFASEDEKTKELNWTIPYDVWKTQTLGASQPTGLVMQLPDKYLDSNSSVILQGSAPAYAHFDAYWNSSAPQVDPQTGVRTVTLTENTHAFYFDDVQPADLATNDTIQTNLPEIQSIAQSIRQQVPDGNAYEQVSAILMWLAKNYQYDYEMVNDGIVRSLTTAEALKNHKGVCQHYAVVFTAIARALNIPTRIVTGYALWGAQAGPHAWVEAQTDPRLWSVIEPQNSYIIDTHTRLYFPVIRGSYLEDENVSMMDYMQAFENTDDDVLLPAAGK